MTNSRSASRIQLFSLHIPLPFEGQGEGVAGLGSVQGRGREIGCWTLVIGHSVAAALALGIVASAAAEGAEGSEAAARSGIYLFRDALWSANADGTQARPLTKGMSVYAYDVAPDGTRVAFAAGAWQGDRKRRELVGNGVWLVNADGTGLRRLDVPPAAKGPQGRVGQLRWSPDGRSLAFDMVGGRSPHEGGGMLYVLHPPDGKVLSLVKGPVHGFEWTPDGRIKYRQTAPGEAAPTEWVVAPNRTAPKRLAGTGQVEAGAPQAVTRTGATAAPPVPPGAVPQPQPQLVPPPPARLEAAQAASVAFNGAGAD